MHQVGSSTWESCCLLNQAAPPLPESRLRVLDGPFAPSKNHKSPPPPISTKTQTPRVNPTSTCMFSSLLTMSVNLDVYADGTNLVESFLHSNLPPPPLQSPRTASSSRSASPIMLINERKSPYQMPSRSATLPLPVAIPSPERSISQDCAFPPFPTAKSRSATPTTPSESSFPFTDRIRASEQNQHSDAQPPLTPRSIAGSSMMQRMDSIAPGPFNLGDKGSAQKRGHGKSTSISNSQNFKRSISSGSSKFNDRRPSTSSSNYTRNRSISSTSRSSRFTFERSKTDVPAVPAMPQQGEVTRQESSKREENERQSIEAAFDFGSFGQGNRSQTFPTHGDSGKSPDDRASFHRTPSEPTVRSHKPRPSVAAAVMQPLHEIGSTSSFKPSKSLRGRATALLVDRSQLTSSVGLSEARDDNRLTKAPPVPIPVDMRSVDPGKSYHTPHESTSSNESYSSGTKTGSSRSSPPLNDSPLKVASHSSVTHRIENLFNGFHFDVERRLSSEELDKPKDNPLTGYIRPRPPKPSTSVYQTEPIPSTYEKASQRNDTPVTSPEDYVASSSSSHSDSLRVVPAPKVPPPPQEVSAQRPRTANKGNCRGCGELIKGKSVSSADGRLTGRYHKQCFVCKTCRAPFQTADFYVMHNHPYCGRHYHELNGSLCKTCDRGIEGHYLETDRKLKFHPHCFSCQECHRILRDDYFEWNGRTLCEQHASRAAQQPSSLGPGRRFPERRTTRLMMM